MERRRRRWGRDLGLLVVAILVFLTLATSRGGDAALYPPRPGEAVSVYLIDNGFHTDLAVPSAAFDGHLAGRAVSATTSRPWVMIGWGDARFYVGSGVSLGRGLDGLRALFGPGNPSVIRIEGLARAPDQLFAASDVHVLRLSKAGLARLAARADRSLAVTADGAPAVSALGGEADSRFFRSVEHFSILHLCNHWTADLLSAAGAPTTPVLDTLPIGLRLDLAVRAGVPL